MANGSEEDDNADIVVPPDTATWRYMVMRDIRALNNRLNHCVTNEVFDAKVGPIQRVMWLIFTVVTTGLVGAVLALVLKSGPGK